jgi:hypothetical protein
VLDGKAGETFEIGDTTYEIIDPTTGKYKVTKTETYGNIFGTQDEDGNIVWKSAEGDSPTYSETEIEQAYDAKI